MSTSVSSSVPESLQSFLSAPKKLLIDGQWVAAGSGKTFDVYDPATDQVIAQVAEGESADVDLAVSAARKAFDDGPWSKMTASDRSRLIWKVGELIEEHAVELAQLETLDNGKPFSIAKAADVALAADMFRYMAGWATKIEGNTIPLNVPYAPDQEFHAFTLKEPIGVVGQIIPWNFPLLMAAWKLGPALATGCTIILKPAEQTPLSAIRLGELLQEAGIPDGVVNIITGFGETAGAAIASHEKIDKVAFTGSTEVGKLIINSAAGNLKKVTLELGGKSPNVVYDDADLDLAIAGAADAIFFNQGQVCSAGSRLFIQKGIYDDVVAGVSEIAKNLKVGNGFHESTQMGPLVSREQFQRVTGYLKAGLEAGAEVSAGGASLDRPGYFVQPTVLKNATAEMSVVREEIFGPVVAAMSFENDSEIACRANESAYGLAAGIWTRDISKAHRLAKAVKAGTVWINCYSIFDAALPFGGYKQSGWGREMGHASLENYLQTKSVCIQI
ncbi:aldehyde dehydrogenase family protein [Rubinisphaera italica]|uniref:Phenylacetaldehyde dehydrogenase n=1 Tax=Rubinisphaera italica TaxID=2527969 RepID=A0A5C5XCG8_9PLAN|nr:aldehyde dehydrogenase family protein [Rubinisphaera italica]TWT59993.1 Phenylacetaldehyde dehydrogenase [Rubinisphaera italica]